MRRLLEWMRASGTTQVQLSEATGIPQPLISKYLLGKLCPRIHNALKIERATDGVVPVEAWDEADAAGGDPSDTDGTAAA